MLVASLACGEPEPPVEPTPEPDRVALLQAVAEDFAEAFEKREWATVWRRYPADFKAKCSLAEFGELMVFYFANLGIPEDGVEATIDGVQVEGDQGWFDWRLHLAGDDTDLFGDDDDDSPTNVWQDGQWVNYVSPEEMANDWPCEYPLLL